MTARLLADSRAPSLGVRKRPLIIAHSEIVELAIRPNRVQRLKHRPEKEHPQMLHAVPRLAGVYDYYDLQNAHWNSQETGTFNYDGSWF